MNDISSCYSFPDPNKHSNKLVHGDSCENTTVNVVMMKKHDEYRLKSKIEMKVRDDGRSLLREINYIINTS